MVVAKPEVGNMLSGRGKRDAEVHAWGSRDWNRGSRLERYSGGKKPMPPAKVTVRGEL